MALARPNQTRLIGHTPFMNVENAILSAAPSRVGRPSPQSWIARHRWFALFVILPVLVSALYYGLIASDQYVSNSSFVIKSSAQRPGQLSTFANLFQSTGLSSGQEQAEEVIAYIESRTALSDLQKRIDVRGKFAAANADWLSRFPAPWRSDRFEDLYKFYGNMVTVRMDKETGVAVLEVKAFTPEDAHDLNANLLTLSENLVNRLNLRAQHTAIAEAEKRVGDAEVRVSNARVALANYRNDQQLLDPGKQASGVLDVSNKLVSEQVALQGQLSLMRHEAPQNPTIPALAVRLAAIDRAIGAQNGRAVGTSYGIASKLGNYERLAAEQDFATQNLAAAGTSLEQARIEAQKQQFYLERVAEPNAPDLALFPHRLSDLLTITGSLLCLYFIGWMFVVGILEHAPED